jgi:ketosteroid isomerase-like protein
MVLRLSLPASLVMLSLAACHPEAYVASPTVDPIPAVKVAAAEFDQAQLRGDRAAIERFLASDFVFVRGAGVVADRNAFIAAFTDPKQHLEPFVIEHPVAIRLADTAVIIGGEATLKGTDNGEPFSEHIRYSDVFQLRDGRWQVVYTQVTMVK